VNAAETPSRRQAIPDYDQAARRLADVIEEVWRACEHLDGPNLAEAVSHALGTAAKRLARTVTVRETARGLEPDEAGSLYEAAGDLLVRHRPASREAEHVRRLMFPPELIPDPT
jgi:hypothetical protein